MKLSKLLNAVHFCTPCSNPVAFQEKSYANFNTDCGFLLTCSYYGALTSYIYDPLGNSVCPERTLFLVLSHNRLLESPGVVLLTVLYDALNCKLWISLRDTRHSYRKKTEHESSLEDYTLGINSAMCNLKPMALYTYTVQSSLIGSNIKIHDHCFTDVYLPDVGERIILRWIFRKWDVGAWTGSSWLRIGTGGGHVWMR